MIAILIILLLQLVVCFAGARCTKHSAEEFLPVSLIGMVVFIYIFGLFSILDVGVLVALLASAFFALYAFVFKKNKNRIYIFKSSAIYIYIVVVALFVWCSYGRKVYAWDECSHWALSVKAMTTHNQLYFIPTANIKFPSYPPGSSIFHYLGQKLNYVMTGHSYCEWLLFVTFNMLCASFAIPALNKYRDSSLLYKIALAIVLIVLPMCFYDEMYGILQIETMLAMAVFYVFCLFAYENSSKTIIVFRCMGIAMLVLLKDSGFYFALIIPILFLLIDWISEKKQFIQSKHYVPYLIYAAVIGITKWSWSNALERNHTKIIWSDPIDLNTLWNVILGRETGYRRTVFVNFWKELLNPQIHIGPVAISFLTMFIVLTAASVIMMLLRNRQKAERKGYYLLAPIFITAFYVLGLLFVYMFKFEANEAMSLNSYPRYTKVAYVMWILVLAFDFFEYIHTFKNRYFWIIIPISVAVLGLGALKSNLIPLLTREDAEYSIQKQEMYDSCAKQITKHVNSSERVYILTQEHDGFEYHMLYYLIHPIHPNDDGFSIGRPMVSEEFEEDVWTKQIPCEEWRNDLIDNYSHVYVYSSNESLEEDYAPLFPEGVQEQTLYKVDKSTGELTPVV